MSDNPPLIAHVIYRLAIGGLENGLVNLINKMPTDRFRHVIICADDFTDFRNRIVDKDVEVYALRKRPGNDWRAHMRLWRLLRRLKPAIVHTRNVGTIEYSVTAMLAGVRCRVHGEHGRDMFDIDGSNKKYALLRRIYNPFIHCFIALSKDLEGYLQDSVGIHSKKIVQLYNGVDCERFVDKSLQKQSDNSSAVRIGTVGRLQAEKDQANLVRAFAVLRDKAVVAGLQVHLQLSLIGDGPDREKLESLVRELAIEENVEFLGARDDVPQLMQSLDIFALPSLGEGISNTILEAMATGLPVVATAVGGNPELVDEGNSGYLVPSADAESLAVALFHYIEQPDLIARHGKEGRRRIERYFSMDAMVNAYMEVYSRLLR
jgi:sugar transferase (PEP-CTERM/EpsH1 system associated)